MDDDLERYREAMHRLRGPVAQLDNGELPRDPDADHLPPGLEELEGKAVTVSGVDRETGEVVHERGTLTTAPGIHGDLARREQS